MPVFASFATTVLYALPAAAALLYAWFQLIAANRRLDRACEFKTKVAAEDALASFLKKNGASFPIQKGGDYLENAYDPDKGEIRLSPDVFGCVDACSIASALNAGSQALAHCNAPASIHKLARLHSITTWWFWGVFCILGFAVMGESFVGTCVGYATLIPLYAMFSIRKNIMKRNQAPALEFVQSSGLFNPEEATVLKKTLAAAIVNP